MKTSTAFVAAASKQTAVCFSYPTCQFELESKQTRWDQWCRNSASSSTGPYLYIGRGDWRVDSQKTAGYNSRQISARPAKYTPMNVARAPTVLARSSVLQMLEAMSEAIPRGDTYMMAVTCKEGGWTQPQQVCNWCLPTCMHAAHIKRLLQHP